MKNLKTIKIPKSFFKKLRLKVEVSKCFCGKDVIPLQSIKHPEPTEEYKKNHPEWFFNTGFKQLDKILDWIWVLIHRPKLTESNLEKAEIEIKK